MEGIPEHIEAFLHADIYPHPARDIQLIQTHISWVILAGEFAYKFKKPVSFGFLDFSTLEKRKYFCRRELELNSRSSPSIYLDVQTVRRDGEHYQLNGEGESVDYCLKMRRFSQIDLFDHKIKSNRFNPYWMDILASDCACFHASSTVNRDIDHIGLLQSHINSNLEIARKTDRKTIQALSQFANDSITQLRPLLEKRQNNGFIRLCHGDLHLKNITLVEHHPQPFDCIEFNDEYSTIDTINDVAFLVMDCDAHGRSDLGFRFLSRYLEFSGDYDGVQLLPLYLFYRATVRGKVTSLLADELGGSACIVQQHKAEKYFELALHYTEPRVAKLFAVGGLSGSGKSHLALLGSAAEMAIIIRTDATRKRIAASHPELKLYGREMHIRSYEAMFDAAETCIHAGFPVILDATFIHPDSRRAFKAFADRAGIVFQFYWLDIQPQLLRKRIRQRQADALDISDADLHVLEQQLAEYRKPSESWIQFIDSTESWPSASQTPQPD